MPVVKKGFAPKIRIAIRDGGQEMAAMM